LEFSVPTDLGDDYTFIGWTNNGAYWVNIPGATNPYRMSLTYSLAEGTYYFRRIAFTTGYYPETDYSNIVTITVVRR
jgi:hypothetical protein